MLEKLIANLELQVEPFALCDIRDGWRLALARPGAVVVHFSLSGGGTLEFAGRRVEIGPGTLVVIPSTLAHVVATPGASNEVGANARDLPSGTLERVLIGDDAPGFVMACGRVEATYGGVTALFDRFDEPLIFDFGDSEQLPALFEALLREHANPQPGGDVMASTLMRQCFILLLRRLVESGDDRLAWISALHNPRLGRVAAAILDDPGASHSVESLSRLAGMSRSVFSERFRDGFGRSPMDFVRDVRMRHAAQLLRRTDLPVESVAGRVGLSSRSHFSQAFVDYHGISPREFRSSAER